MTTATAYSQNLTCVCKNSTQAWAHTLNRQDFLGVVQGCPSKGRGQETSKYIDISPFSSLTLACDAFKFGFPAFSSFRKWTLSKEEQRDLA